MSYAVELVFLVFNERMRVAKRCFYKFTDAIERAKDKFNVSTVLKPLKKMIILTLHYKGWDKTLSLGLEQILVYLNQKG